VAERADGPNFLKEISIVTAAKTYKLGGPPFVAADADAPQRPMTLASEAMRWSYVLRSRERWRDDSDALALHQRDATATMHALGLSDDALREIAVAGRVVVTMPFKSEGWGWDGRIFPWEFVLARATRRYRAPGTAKLTVMRHLMVERQFPDPPRDPTGKLLLNGRVLFVKSLPGPLAQAYAADDEAERVRAAFGLRSDDPRWGVLNNPALEDLRVVCRDLEPTVVHLAGVDTHQGLALIRVHGGPAAQVAARGALRAVGDLLRDEDTVFDGYMMRSPDGMPAMVSPLELGAALTASGTRQPLFVGLNLWNSAARVAPLMLGAGVHASMGFQDAFDDALAEYFFETLYATLAGQQWNVPAAFDAAWAATRRQVDLVPGTGVALWARAPLIEAQPVRPAAPPQPPRRAAGVQVRIDAKREINYCELHNQGDYKVAHTSALFERFELTRPAQEPPSSATVHVELHCGPEIARYAAEVELTEERMSLLPQIKVPLTATLIRSVSEAIVSTLFVQVEHAGAVVYKNTVATRLVPVDQWRDNRTSGPWLPSFVLPRDPAVERAIMAAQRYVRVIRDDPASGFEGYQAADPADPPSLDGVDLQVESIWAALLHEWQLGYINPPPTYGHTLDSQRLRTPSAVHATRMGTCIDLALLFSACLELVDIHPVIFLLKGHALPGYWRHHRYRAELPKVLAAAEVTGADADRTAAPGEQAAKWTFDNYDEVRKFVRDGLLVPIETVRLTEHCGFREARRAGAEALAERDDFELMLDIVSARERQVTPLPIVQGAREAAA
jgi:hypothetical protein